ncbi:MAG: SPOR domain-containing protein [Myxococcota bacterium]
MTEAASHPRLNRARRGRARIIEVGARELLLGGLVLAAVFGLGLWAGVRWAPAVSPAQEAEVAPPSPSWAPAARAAPAASAIPRQAPPAAVASAAPIAPPPEAPAAPASAVTPEAVAAPAPSASPVPSFRTTLPDHGFGLQLGAFETQEEAEAFLQAHAGEFGKEPVFAVPAEIKGRGTWVRVRLGLERTRAGAEQLRQHLSGSLRTQAIVVSHR